MENNIHEGHRKRMRDRFVEHGFESFSEIEKMEFILNFTIVRANTNFLAHELLNEFDNLVGVFEAPTDRLLEINGIGQRTVDMLHAIPDILKAYEEEKFKGTITLDSTSKMVDYLKHYFRSAENEMFYLLCLDSKYSCRGCKKVSDGAINYVNIDLRNLVKIAIDYKATKVVLVHNHPNYFANESIEDIESTKHIYEALKPFSISVIDHIILSNDSYVSFKEKGLI